jgi:hypothetical protein
MGVWVDEVGEEMEDELGDAARCVGTGAGAGAGSMMAGAGATDGVVGDGTGGGVGSLTGTEGIATGTAATGFGSGLDSARSRGGGVLMLSLNPGLFRGGSGASSCNEATSRGSELTVAATGVSGVGVVLLPPKTSSDAPYSGCWGWDQPDVQGSGELDRLENGSSNGLSSRMFLELESRSSKPSISQLLRRPPASARYERTKEGGFRLRPWLQA